MRGLSCAIAIAVAFLCAGTARAGEPVLLGFGSSYVAPDGGSCVHRGIDVACEPGAPVEALANGTVTFAGSVPGPHGGSVCAVTIETAVGRITVMPLERVDVAAGEHVEQGACVGALSEGGDPSSAATHLHIGLKRSGLYVDPTELLSVTTRLEGDDSACDAPVERVPETPTTADAASPSQSPTVQDVISPDSLSAPRAVGSAAGDAVEVAHARPAPVVPAVDTAASAISVAAGAGAMTQGAGRAVMMRRRHAAVDAIDPRSSSVTGSMTSRATAGSIGLAAAVVCVACFSGAFLFARRIVDARVMSGRVRPVWDPVAAPESR